MFSLRSLIFAMLFTAGCGGDGLVEVVSFFCVDGVWNYRVATSGAATRVTLDVVRTSTWNGDGMWSDPEQMDFHELPRWDDTSHDDDLDRWQTTVPVASTQFDCEEGLDALAFKAEMLDDLDQVIDCGVIGYRAVSYWTRAAGASTASGDDCWHFQ